MLTESDIYWKLKSLVVLFLMRRRLCSQEWFCQPSNCKALGKLSPRRSAGLGIRTRRFQRGYSLALGPAASPLSPSGSFPTPAPVRLGLPATQLCATRLQLHAPSPLQSSDHARNNVLWMGQEGQGGCLSPSLDHRCLQGLVWVPLCVSTP